MIFRSIFLALLLTTFISSILADTDSNDFWVGKWQVEAQDIDCDQGCCCPNGTLTAKRDPSNTSTLLVTGTYTNSPVCAALGMTNGVYKAAWPFDVALWEGHFLYAANGEQFTVLALNKKTYADRDSIYADITIDDTKIENVDEPSFCYVAISKVYEANSAGLVKVSAAVLGIVMAMLYF